MKECIKCQKEIDESFDFCPYCGRKQIREKSKRQRGNGQGTVYKDGSRYRAIVTIGYYLDENGKLKRKTKSQRFDTKREAIQALPRLQNEPIKKQKKDITFKGLYDKWLPTHQAGKSTLDCYKAAIKYFEPVWFYRMQDIDIDDLQECLDDCGHGKRTQQNMKAVCGLIYKYGIPRQAVPDNLNLAQYLKVNGEDSTARSSFTDAEILLIKNNIGKVDHADWIYCMIYLGFRPAEFLALSVKDYDKKEKAFVGGAKTEAGTNRTVTVSPKIVPYVESIIGTRTGGAFIQSPKGTFWDYSNFRQDVFYPVLEKCGIENPKLDNGVHKYSPHSCRHTFATLMKRVTGADKDKLELIGHTSTEMLRYYQDVNLSDLRKITDNI
jgi:integrase